ncbi:hypothetical protein Tco_1474581 [Tanacetum coccineum]
MPTKMELVLEQTQQGTSHEVSVSTEGVEERKRNVRIKGVKKEALHILRQKPGRSSQDLEVQVKMEMKIPRTSGVYFITACSYSTNTSNDIMKVQAYVSKLPQL